MKTISIVKLNKQFNGCAFENLKNYNCFNNNNTGVATIL